MGNERAPKVKLTRDLQAVGLGSGHSSAPGLLCMSECGTHLRKPDRPTAKIISPLLVP